MTLPDNPTSHRQITADDRTAELVAAYHMLKAQRDEIAERLDAVTTSLKAMLGEQLPAGDTASVTLVAPSSGYPALVLRRSMANRLDTARLKREQAETYVAYSVESPRVELRSL